MRRLLTALAALLAVALVVGLIIAGRPRPESTPEAPGATPTPVEVAVVERRDLERTLDLSGTLKARAETSLTAMVPGRVLAVHVAVGDRVEAGQLLVQLDPTQARAQVAEAEAGLRAAQAKLRQAEKGQPLQAARGRNAVEQARAAVEAARAQLRKAEEGARLQAAEARGDLDRAEAGLQAAQAQLRAARRGPRPQQVRQAEAQVRQAEAGFKAASKHLERAEFLHDRGGFTGAQLDQARADVANARAALEAAREQLSLVQAGASPEEVAAAEAQVREAEAARDTAKAALGRTEVAEQDVRAARTQLRQAEAGLRAAEQGRGEAAVAAEDVAAARAAVEQARAGVALARSQLRATRIVSPTRATVASLHVSPGEMAAPGMPVLSLVTPGAVLLEAPVSAESRRHVTPGRRAEVRVDAAPGRTFRGIVDSVAPAPEPGTEHYVVRIAVESVGVRLPVGAFAQARLVAERREAVPAVPTSALLQEGDETSVMRVEGGRARRVGVETGLRAGGWTEVRSGLALGDRVALAPALVGDGERVAARR